MGEETIRSMLPSDDQPLLDAIIRNERRREAAKEKEVCLSEMAER